MAHITITTSSNIQQWLRRYEKKKGLLKDRVLDEPRKQAMIGQQLGRAIAPKDTGNLINAISYRVADKTKQESTAMVWVKPLPNRHNGRTASKYSGIHHSIGGRGRLPRLPRQKKASTGDFHWLFVVREELSRRYKKNILGHIQRFR